MSKEKSPNGQTDPARLGLMQRMTAMVGNLATSRQSWIKNYLNASQRDLNLELGYPDQIDANDYNCLYERNGIAERVVQVYPDECWSVRPSLYENVEYQGTDFEMQWDDLVEELNLYHHLHRADILSGIGRYGVLLLGFNDAGQGLERPVTASDNLELLFVRSFPENLIEVKKWEEDPTNERYLHPLMYSIKVGDSSSQLGMPSLPRESIQVHWTRIIHLADNRGHSEVFGVPRMRSNYNRILDLRKLLGGSAEMFWKGAFPGYAFEVNPEFVAAAGLDTTEAGKEFKATMRSEFYEYSEGLQRYIALLGVNAKSLAPQVANPEKHIQMEIRAISMSIGVPLRIFMGSEQGSLASSQDTRTWNRRLAQRQNQYLTPLVIRPLVDRLIELGILPKPVKYRAKWPDLDVLSEQDKVDVADKRATAMQKYVAGNIDRLVAPMDFLVGELGFTEEKAKIIWRNAKRHMKSKNTMEGPMAQIMQEAAEAGGADNMNPGQPAGGQNPRNPAADRSRSASGASRTTN